MGLQTAAVMRRGPPGGIIRAQVQDRVVATLLAKIHCHAFSHGNPLATAHLVRRRVDVVLRSRHLSAPGGPCCASEAPKSGGGGCTSLPRR